jgi:hypothetical protein
MNLKDALQQVEREQPHLTGTAKMQAIKALRSQPTPTKEEPQEQTPAEDQRDEPAWKTASVGEAWGFLVFIVVAMQLTPWIAWGSLTGEPHWYDVLHAALLLGAVVELASAYRRRRS